MSFEGLRVFIVEDESLVRMLLEDMLDELGCRVAGHAAQLAEALAEAQTIACDVAILDVNLGGENTQAVGQALASRNIPYLFATGYGDSLRQENARPAPVLGKPFRLAELEVALQTLLSSRATQGVTHPPSN